MSIAFQSEKSDGLYVVAEFWMPKKMINRQNGSLSIWFPNMKWDFGVTIREFSCDSMIQGSIIEPKESWSADRVAQETGLKLVD